jgi:multiple sugar transport system substrate-binding protein
VLNRSGAALSRRQVLRAGLVAAGGALLAACGQAAAPTNTPAPAAAAKPTEAPKPAAEAPKPTEAPKPAAAATTAPAAAAPAPAAKGGGTIVYWRPVKGKGETNGTKQISDEFSKANGGVQFKVEEIPNNEMPQKYQSALATGSMPDILALDTEWPAVYAALGALADPPAELQAMIKEKTFPVVQEVTTYKGKFVAVPLDSSNLVIGYNVKLLKDAGIDEKKPPADWNELGDIAAKLTKRDGSGKLQQTGLDTDFTDEWAWNVWLASAGGRRWHNLEGTDFLEPPFVAAAQIYPEWVFNKKVNDVAGIEDPFTHGKAGMTMAGPWTITGMKADAPDLEWRSWNVPPQKAGGQSGTTLGGWHLGAYSKSKNLDTVWSFITFHMKPENKVLWYTLTARVPAWKDVADDPIFQSDPNRATAVKQQSTHLGVGQPASPGYLEVQAAVTTTLERIMKNKEDVMKVLKEEKTKVDPVFVQKSKG